MKNDNERILEEVSRLKEKANKLSLQRKVWELYEAIKCYPSWETNRPDALCSVISKFHANKNGGLVFFYEDIKFEFLTSERRDSYDDEDKGFHYVDLTLKRNDKDVFKINMSDINYDHHDFYSSPKWKVKETESFFDGDWVNSILKLSETIAIFDINRHKVEEEVKETKRLNELKNKFGSA